MSSDSPSIQVQLPNTRIAIVASLWNSEIVDELIVGASEALDEASASYEVVRVAGAFELSLMIKNCLKEFDAAIALGVVIRGDTPHFDYICQSVTQGLTQISIDVEKPVGFGVLMVENEQQAWDRCQKNNNKGKESAEAVLLSLAQLLKLK